MKQDIMLISRRTKHSESLCAALRAFEMDVSQVETYQDVLAGLALHSPAFILLDFEIKDAHQVLAKIADSILRPYPYIIAADACLGGEKFAALLNMGADACVQNPINAKDVLALIRAVLRRERKIIWPYRNRLLPCIEYKDLAIDPLRRIVTMKGVEIALTAKEFEILYLLAQNAGTVLTKEEIYRSVWNTDCNIVATSVTDHISSLRQKLGIDRKDTHYIQTVFGVGYRFSMTK